MVKKPNPLPLLYLPTRNAMTTLEGPNALMSYKCTVMFVDYQSTHPAPTKERYFVSQLLLRNSFDRLEKMYLSF